MIEAKIYPVRSEQASWSIGADKTITVKDTTSGWFFPLNNTATLIWDMLDGTSDVPAIAAALCAQFEVDEDAARTDVEEFIEQARDLGLITERSVPLPNQQNNSPNLT
jgi:hypothetical protein